MKKLFKILMPITGLGLVCVPTLASCNKGNPTKPEITLSIDGKDEILVGNSTSYTVKVQPEGQECEIVWSVANKDTNAAARAEIDQTGKLTTHATGKVVITAAVKDNEKAVATKEVNITSAEQQDFKEKLDSGYVNFIGSINAYNQTTIGIPTQSPASFKNKPWFVGKEINSEAVTPEYINESECHVKLTSTEEGLRGVITVGGWTSDEIIQHINSDFPTSQYDVNLSYTKTNDVTYVGYKATDRNDPNNYEYMLFDDKGYLVEMVNTFPVESKKVFAQSNIGLAYASTTTKGLTLDDFSVLYNKYMLYYQRTIGQEGVNAYTKVKATGTYKGTTITEANPLEITYDQTNQANATISSDKRVVGGQKNLITFLKNLQDAGTAIDYEKTSNSITFTIKGQDGTTVDKRTYDNYMYLTKWECYNNGETWNLEFKEYGPTFKDFSAAYKTAYANFKTSAASKEFKTMVLETGCKYLGQTCQTSCPITYREDGKAEANIAPGFEQHYVIGGYTMLEMIQICLTQFEYANVYYRVENGTCKVVMFDRTNTEDWIYHEFNSKGYINSAWAYFSSSPTSYTSISVTEYKES